MNEGKELKTTNKKKVIGTILIIFSLLLPLITFTYAYVIEDLGDESGYGWLIILELMALPIILVLGILLIINESDKKENRLNTTKTKIGEAGYIVCFIGFAMLIRFLSPYMPAILSVVGIILYVIASKKGDKRKLILVLNLVCLAISTIFIILFNTYYSRHPEIEGHWSCTAADINDKSEFTIDLEEKKFYTVENHEVISGTYTAKKQPRKVLTTNYILVLNTEITDEKNNVINEKSKKYEMSILGHDKKEMILKDKSNNKKYLCNK